MDLSRFAWFVPLIVGAALTFFFGWLDSTLKDRRQVRRDVAADAKSKELRQRTDAKAHAQRALEVATELRDELYATPPEPHGQPKPYDHEKQRTLANLGILLPEERLRDAVTDATNVLGGARSIADWEGWDETPSALQTSALTHLRNVLGAYIREDEQLPRADLDWLSARGDALRQSWEEWEENMRRHESEGS